MPEIINKVWFYSVGSLAPKGSRYKGIISADTLFGSGDMTIFEYNTRYAREKEDKDFKYDQLFEYNARYNNDVGFTYTSDGYLDTEDKLNKFKTDGYNTLNHNGALLWQIVFSPKDIETCQKYHLTSQKDYACVLDEVMPSFLKKYGFEPENVVWFEDFHPDNRTSIEPHPHIHLCFYEKVQTKTKGKLPKSALADFKTMMANKMLKRSGSIEYQNVLKDVNFKYKAIKDRVNNVNLDNVKSIKDLYSVLPKTGRLQFNSTNNIPFRKAELRVVDNLLEQPEFKDLYDSYVNDLKKWDAMINRVDGNGEPSLKQITEVRKLKEDIANKILQHKKDYIDETKYENYTKNKEGKKLSHHGAISKNLDNRKLKITNTERKIHRFINGAIAKRQQEIEDEIEKYLKSTEPSYSDSY